MDDTLGQRFHQHRDLVRGVAYRMLGSLAEADDAVQETWLRLAATDTHSIGNLPGWLTTVVSRVCLDMLRTRQARREDFLGDDLPETADPAAERNPEHEAVLVDSVGRAVLIVLDRLNSGMVITGAADRAPSGVVRRLVYCDAYVPEDGQSCWDLTTDAYRSVFLAGAAADGATVAPPPGSDPRVTAHPLASFLQRIQLNSGGLRDVKTRDYVYLSGWDGTPFTALRDRLADDPAWQVHTLDSGHDVWRDAPQEFLEILLLGE